MSAAYLFAILAGVAVLLLTQSAQAKIVILRDNHSKKIVAVTGLSDNEPCGDGNGTGTVDKVTFDRLGVSGFTYIDASKQSNYVNTSFYHGTPAETAEIRAWLKEVIRPKAVVAMELRFCGAAGRVVEVQTIEVVSGGQPASAPAPDRAPVATLSLSPAPNAPAVSPDQTDGKWRYGIHPVLGLSAHVTKRGETIGLACAFRGVDLLRADTVHIRMTPGIAASATSQFGVLLFYDRGIGGGNYAFKAKGNFVQHEENACGIVAVLQKSRRLLVVEGKQIGISVTRTGVVTEFEQRGVTKRISSDAQLDQLTDAFDFPLDGAAGAVRQLINACPAIRADIRNACGAE